MNSDSIERVKKIVANPVLASADDVQFLRSILETYPFFKPGYFLLARLTNDVKDISSATINSNGKLCYEILKKDFTSPSNKDSFTDIEEEEEIYNEIVEFDNLEFINSIRSDVNKSENEERKFFEIDIEAIQEVTIVPPSIETVVPDEPEHQTISKYDDDNMPYTFLWWLEKTRAAHKDLFQPYATPKNPLQGDLQQQYVEHIFHLQTGLEKEEIRPSKNINRQIFKEEALIEAFLKSDPQIKPPPVDKLDNENKARKSAEDQNDVVSETLANIYIEQMLYHKAIETYEKLSLKFPEKSRYFADLIKSLEKKI